MCNLRFRRYLTLVRSVMSNKHISLAVGGTGGGRIAPPNMATFCATSGQENGGSKAAVFFCAKILDEHLVLRHCLLLMAYLPSTHVLAETGEETSHHGGHLAYRRKHDMVHGFGCFLDAIHGAAD